MSSRSSKIIPTLNNILTVRLDSPETSNGGIVIPETSRPRSKKARVLRVGEKIMKIMPGHIVIFPDYAGIEVEHDGEKYLFLENQDILGYYNEDN